MYVFQFASNDTMQITATDKDITDVITYEIVGDNKYFSINKQTGIFYSHIKYLRFLTLYFKI